MAEKRRKPRFPLRLRAKIWSEGKKVEEVGYTENVSTGGVFVTISEPPKRGTRVRVEIMGSEQGFMVEGIVSHARRVAKELQRVKQAGIGVRFLRFGDLLKQFRLAAVEVTDSGTTSKDAALAESSYWQQRKKRGADRGTKRRGVPGERRDRDDDEESGQCGVVLEGVWKSGEPETTEPSAGAEAATGAEQEPEPDGGDRVYAVKFSDKSDFFDAYDIDIRSGRLFIPTTKLAPFNAAVTVELYPPASKKAFQFSARVEKRVEPQLDSGGGETGIVVRFEEPSVVIQTLAVIVRALKG